MPKYIKSAMRIIMIFALFVGILISNIWLLESNIHIANSIEPCTSRDRNNIACLKQPFNGIEAFNMYISAGLFVFASLFFCKSSKNNLLLLCFFGISYIALSELSVKVFNLSVLYKGLISGNLTSGNTLYFLNKSTTALSIVMVFMTSSIGGGFAIIIKKFYINHLATTKARMRAPKKLNNKEIFEEF